MAPDNELISTILSHPRTVAVVGLSDKPHRASYEVASYLQHHGFRIIPINPMRAGTHILGELCYASLTDAATAMEKQGRKIEIADCFRRSEDIPPVIDEAIKIGAPYVWMQLGIMNETAAAKARAAGLTVVMDHCIKIEHGKLHAQI